MKKVLVPGGIRSGGRTGSAYAAHVRTWHKETLEAAKAKLKQQGVDIPPYCSQTL